MKTLIVYYSFTGNNAILGGYLKERLNADLYGIAEVRQRTGFTIFLDMLFNRDARIKTPSFKGNYDRLIILGPIWNAKVASPVRSFLKTERGLFSEYAFVSVCGGRAGQEEKIGRQLTALAGKAPVVLELLSLNELLSEERKKESRKGVSFVIERKDLERFGPVLEELVRKLGGRGERS